MAELLARLDCPPRLAAHLRAGPGSAHQQAGRQLLLARGIIPGLARFAAGSTKLAVAARRLP